MHFAMRMALAAMVVALLAHTSGSAQAKEGDWASGWNTWKDSEKGDWVEYSMELGNKVRFEVTGTGDGKVSYKHIIYDAKGVEVSNKQISDKDWKSIRLQSSLPRGNTVVTWSKSEVAMGTLKFECDVASWSMGGTSTSVYYSKSIPCGGIVKTQTNAKDVVWLSAFNSKKLGEAKGDAPKKVESKLPKFWASEGNYVVLKVSLPGKPETYQRREVTSVAEESSKWTVAMCEADGTAKGSPKEMEQTKADWDTKYATPKEKGKKVKVGEIEVECDVFETVSGSRTTTEWVHQGAVVKTVVKDGDKETVLLAVILEIK